MTSGHTAPLPPAVPATETVFDGATVIGDVAETLFDGVRGYLTAADAVDDTGLAAMLRERASHRRLVAERLVQVAGDAGYAIDVDPDGTASGGIHRAWINLEGAVAGDEAIVKSAITGEEHALDECEEALGTGIGEPVDNAIRTAAADVREAIEVLRRHAA